MASEKYEISKKRIINKNTNEWDLLTTRKTKKAAINFVVRQSERLAGEFDIRGFDSDYELIHHSFYEAGKLKIDMSI